VNQGDLRENMSLQFVITDYFVKKLEDFFFLKLEYLLEFYALFISDVTTLVFGLLVHLLSMC